MKHTMNNQQSQLHTAWRHLRSMVPKPEALPPSLPSKADMVDHGKFSPTASNDEASTLFSSFLFSKLVPKAQDPDTLLRDYEDKLSSPPHFSSDFLDASRQYVDFAFKKGWDRGYERSVKNHILSNGKVVEGHKAADWDLDQQTFQQYCLSTSPLPEGVFSAIKKKKAAAIYDSGKFRLVTVGSKWQHLLAPLHHLIYDHLTRRSGSAVLRGEPLPSSFAGFKASEDPIVSGDFEASTDNLSSLHSISFLSLLRSKSKYVPDAIWDLALESLKDGTVSYKTRSGVTRTFVQRTGQLMGNYLSFPLLCMANLSTLFLVDVDQAKEMILRGLVRVNGDDIVFRAPARFYTMWLGRLHHSGFVINKTKTLVHSSLFTLNSKLFRATQCRVRKLWHLIPKGIFARREFKEGQDRMAAHWAVVMQNIKGMKNKYNPMKIMKQLIRIKEKDGVHNTMIKSPLPGVTDKKWKAFPSAWKVVEQIKAFDIRHSPLKERLRAPDEEEKITRNVWGREEVVTVTVRRNLLKMIPARLATKEEKRDSPTLMAAMMFTNRGRPVVHETNNRKISVKEYTRCVDEDFRAVPDWRRRKEEEQVWVPWGRVVPAQPLVFIAYTPEKTSAAIVSPNRH